MRSALRIALFGAGLWAGAVAAADAPANVTIRMQKESFVPAAASVAPGTRVTWINDDSIPHSVTAGDNRFDSGPILPGKSFAWTAGGAGEIDYHCIFHPSMTAKLTVGATPARATK